MIPSISTNTKQAQFLFFIFYLINLFIIIIIIIFYVEQPKQVECHTSIVQPKEHQTSNPNWSLQPKNSRSKPTGGTKGVKNKNENKKENKNEKKWKDRNKTQTEKVKMYNVGKKKSWLTQKWHKWTMKQWTHNTHQSIQ